MDDKGDLVLKAVWSCRLQTTVLLARSSTLQALITVMKDNSNGGQQFTRKTRNYGVKAL